MLQWCAHKLLGAITIPLVFANTHTHTRRQAAMEAIYNLTKSLAKAAIKQRPRSIKDTVYQLYQAIEGLYRFGSASELRYVP